MLCLLLESRLTAYDKGSILRENVLEVLIYLFENYMTDGDALETNNSQIASELLEAGFANKEIDKAFVWLDELVAQAERRSDGQLNGRQTAEKGIRYYRPQEKASIPVEGRSLLMRLERSGVLDVNSREIIIDRILALDLVDIDVEHVKWVVMMVLCNQTEYPEIIEWAEGMVTETYLPVH